MITAAAAISAAIICTPALVIRRPSLSKRRTNDSAFSGVSVSCASYGSRMQRPAQIRSHASRDQHVSLLRRYIADISGMRRDAVTILRRGRVGTRRSLRPSMLATPLAATQNGKRCHPTAALLLTEAIEPLLINLVTAVTHTDLAARTEYADDLTWIPTK